MNKVSAVAKKLRYIPYY